MRCSSILGSRYSKVIEEVEGRLPNEEENLSTPSFLQGSSLPYPFICLLHFGPLDLT